MAEIPEHAVNAALALLLGMFALYMFAIWRLQTFLREHHRKLWGNLGSPEVMWNNTIQNGSSLSRFIWERQYATVGDMELERRGRLCRALLVGTAGLFMSFAILAVAWVVTR